MAIAVLVACLTLAGPVDASSLLRVLGSGRSAGDFAVTSASASKDKASAIFIRGYGRDLSSFAVVACSRGVSSIGSRSTTLHRMAAGRLYRLKLPFSGDCQVTASLSGSGRIQLQILG
jgi:hypothetical protein